MKRFQHSLAPVTSIAALGDCLANSDYAVQDGELVFCRSTRQLFVYENPSTQVPDGITVVASNFGAGNWILVPSAGGSGFAGYFNTASAGALGSGRLLDVTLAFLGSLANETKVWVRSVRDSWTWYATRADASDGITVVNPTSNGGNPGRFIRDNVPSPTWAKQATWFIDPVNGNDENVGATAGAGNALKTDAERQRRWGVNAVLRQGTTVTYVSDLADTDPTNYDASLGPGGSLTIQGTMTVVKSSTLDVVTSMNRGTQTPWSATSTVAFDGTEVGKFIRITGGANVGAIWGVVKNNGGGSLRFTTPGIPNPAAFSFTRKTPVHLDPYDVVTPSVVPVGTWKFPVTTGAAYGAVTIQNAHLQFGAGIGLLQTGSAIVAIGSCVLDGASMSGPNVVGMVGAGCLLNGFITMEGVFCQLFAGGTLSGASLFVGQASDVALDYDFLMQNSLVQVSESNVTTGYVAWFDRAASGAMICYLGGRWVSKQVNDGADLAWGTANTGYAVIMHEGSYACYTTKPTINGGLGAGRESLVGATDKQWGAIPFADTGATGSQSAIVVKT
jgi:hypothetical protein